jgi:hypothetical protein
MNNRLTKLKEIKVLQILTGQKQDLRANYIMSLCFVKGEELVGH